MIEKEKLERLKEAARSWDIRLMTRERGYEWYKLGFALGPNHTDGEDLVKILNEAIDELLSDKLKTKEASDLAGSRYQNIQSETAYRTLMNSGMFFEFHPELSGDWEQDKQVIFENK